MKKQFDFANKEYPYVLIIGSELNAGKFTLKDMATGEQQEYNLKKLLTIF
jgi:histidyl-tRNA synthetase